MLIKLIFLTTVIASAIAKLDIGTCIGGLEGQWPFDMSMFSGEWFLKHSLDIENQRCVSWTFNYDNSTTNSSPNQYTIHTSGINMNSNKVEVKDGIAKWKDPEGEESELLVSYKNDENVWILTRDRNLTRLNPNILIYLDILKIKTSEINQVSQDFCI